MRMKRGQWLRMLIIGLILMWMMFFVPSGAVMAEEVGSAYALLPAEDVGGPEPDDANYTETTYTDPSLQVEIFSGSTEDTDYMYAHIKILDPCQLRSAAASNFNSSAAYSAVTIARRVNAVVAINGDFFNYQQRIGYIVRQGKRYRSAPTGQDLLIIDSRGDFHILYGAEDKETVEAYLNALPDGAAAWNTFSFGPALIDNGEVVFTQNDPYFTVSPEKKTQRVGIGQLGELEYFIVSTEGPEDDPDSGMTVADFAALMAQVGRELNPDGGALYAYNLDGGSSNTLVFHEQKINSSDRSKVRAVGDIIYFCTLVDSE